MKKAIRYRNNIPFFYDKSPLEMKQDPYENFDLSVKKQIFLHHADNVWNCYPFQKILDFIFEKMELLKPNSIVEIGCGVGRMIGEIASMLPSAHCTGIDYSYQMLSQARKTFLENKSLELDFSQFGFKPKIELQGLSLNNLQLGLSKAEQLPFENETVDFLFSSFALDRFEDPVKAIKEMKRVIKKNGQVLIISPLNFVKPNHWKTLYPVTKLMSKIENLGFKIISFQDNFIIDEPIDIRGNKKEWKCIIIQCSKY